MNWFKNLSEQSEKKKQKQIQTARSILFLKRTLNSTKAKPLIPKINDFFKLTQQIYFCPISLPPPVQFHIDSYMDKHHRNSFIVYNISSRKSTLPHILDYPYCQQVLPLDTLFVIVTEMTQWLKNYPDHVLMIGLSQLNQFIISCLISSLYPDLFPSPSITYPYLQKASGQKSITQSQLRYFEYYEMVQRCGFTPSAAPLVLTTAIIVKSQIDDYFIQIYDHKHTQSVLIFCQLQQTVSQPQIEEVELNPIVTPQIVVYEDFIIKVFQVVRDCEGTILHELVQEQICIHTGFICQNFIRVEVDKVVLDLYFKQATDIEVLSQKKIPEYQGLDQSQYFWAKMLQQISLTKEKNEFQKKQIVDQVKFEQIFKKVQSGNKLPTQAEMNNLLADDNQQLNDHEFQISNQLNKGVFQIDDEPDLPPQQTKDAVDELDDSMKNIQVIEALNTPPDSDEDSDEQAYYENYLKQLEQRA